MTPYKLPDFKYDFGAFEPYLSARIMELHYTKHHAAYVKNANECLAKLDEARAKDRFETLAGLERELAFNLSGHVLHSLFWNCLKPRGGDSPSGEISKALTRDFGSLDHFRHQMSQVANTVMGSGWAALVWEPLGARLLVTQIYDHQSNLAQGGVPLLVIDAWEHAYYLQYQNQRADYVDALWNIWDWKAIAARFAAINRQS